MAKKGDIGRVWDYIVNTQVWRSIMRHGYPDTPRNRSLKTSVSRGRMCSKTTLN